MTSKKVTVGDLRLLLSFLPVAERDVTESFALIKEKEERLAEGLNELQGWCYMYELSLLEALSLFFEHSGMSEELLQISATEHPIQEMARSIEKMNGEVEDFFSSCSPEEREELKPYLPTSFGLVIFFYNTIRCVMTFGCYMNDLVAAAREGDDRALFNAIRIDHTVLGCSTAINRISRAYVLEDKKFLLHLKAALSGRLKKREQANFQKMRLVLQVLYEAKAERLTDEELYELFVRQLNLYSAESKNGDVTKNLRKFTNQYMKDHAST